MNQEYRNHRTAWTVGELAFVEAHYGKIPITELAAHLGRTMTAIRLAAQELGLCKAQAALWTEEEKEVIRTHYADGEGITSVSQLLPGRTRKTIFAMAKKMGVKSARSWQEWECLILRESYASIGTRVAQQLVDRTPEAIKLKANMLGLKYRGEKESGTAFVMWSDEEWHRLETYQHLPYAELVTLFPDRSKASLKKAKERLKKYNNNN